MCALWSRTPANSEDRSKLPFLKITMLTTGKTARARQGRAVQSSLEARRPWRHLSSQSKPVGKGGPQVLLGDMEGGSCRRQLQSTTAAEPNMLTNGDGQTEEY